MDRDGRRRSVLDGCRLQELDLVVEGTRPNVKAGFTPGAVNINSISFVDKDWTGPKGAAASNVATVDKRTGEIVDVDIQINSAEFRLLSPRAPMK